MTRDDLMKYYTENKNLNSEIKLIGRNTGATYTFRHYIEFGTADDKWLNTITESLLNTDCLLRYYDIPKNGNLDILKLLNVGEIIFTVDKHLNTTFYKKIDSEMFIECDKKGHIERTALTEPFFLYSTEEIFDLSLEIKKI